MDAFQELNCIQEINASHISLYDNQYGTQHDEYELQSTLLPSSFVQNNQI